MRFPASECGSPHILFFQTPAGGGFFFNFTHHSPGVKAKRLVRSSLLKGHSEVSMAQMTGWPANQRLKGSRDGDLPSLLPDAWAKSQHAAAETDTQE